MLYPVAPDKLGKMIERIHAASDEANIPRPEFSTPTDEEALIEELDRYMDEYQLHEEWIEGYRSFSFRGRLFLVVDVTWPSPLRTLDEEEVVLFKDVPAGPSRIGMWAMLQYLPEG